MGTERPQTAKGNRLRLMAASWAKRSSHMPGPVQKNALVWQMKIVDERLRHVHGIQDNAALRSHWHVSSLHSTAGQYEMGSKDVRIRCAIRTPDRNEAENLLWEVESLLCCGPAGGGGYRGATSSQAS